MKTVNATMDSLENLLSAAGPVTRRRALKQISIYLKRSNASRISAQKNADGSTYQKRAINAFNSDDTVYFEYSGRKHKVSIIKHGGSYIEGRYPRKSDERSKPYRFQRSKIENLSRASSRPNKKMLLGVKKTIKTFSNTEKAVVSGPGRVSSIHHFGKIEDGTEYPSRQLISLPKKDQQAILNIVLSMFDDGLQGLSA